MPNPYSDALGHAPRREKDREKGPKKRLNPSQVRAKKQEKERALLLRAAQVPGSGAGAMKGDVRHKGLLRLECKTTKHKSFSLTLEMVHKIEEAALSSGEMPAILVEFNDENGQKIAEVAVVPTYVLEGLCNQ